MWRDGGDVEDYSRRNIPKDGLDIEESAYIHKKVT